MKVKGDRGEHDTVQRSYREIEGVHSGNRCSEEASCLVVVRATRLVLHDVELEVLIVAYLGHAVKHAVVVETNCERYLRVNPGYTSEREKKKRGQYEVEDEYILQLCWWARNVCLRYLVR